MMKVFLVIRYGNEDEGPDGDDTIHIVAASSHVEAAAEVDPGLQFAAAGYDDPVIRRRAFAMVIHEIGRTSATDKPMEVSGRLLGIGVCRAATASWMREREGDEWQRVEDVFPDVDSPHDKARAKKTTRRRTKRRERKGDSKRGRERRQSR